jgi:putative protease
VCSSDLEKPEILSPAGNFEKLRSAILFGADAVYLAGKNFGMRAAADNFTLDEIESACIYTHEKNKKLYLAVNTVPRSKDIPELKDYLNEIKSMREKPDALICADIGVVSLAKKILPEVDIHVSTQANAQSWLTCEAWAALGATRVILSRELSFEDIHGIRDNLSNKIELECFIHGAMCVSYSGRCLISNYLTGRDANKGACTQPCRWKYYLSEEKRPNIFLELAEESDEFVLALECGGKSGTFLFSSKDLCMIEHIPDLVKSGVRSFKIEGRMKSAYYAACITNAYRIALDNFYDAGRLEPELARRLKLETESVSRREYDTGFFYGAPDADAKICANPDYIREKTYLGLCVGYEPETSLAIFEQRNKIIKNQRAQILSPGSFGRDVCAALLLDEKNEPLEAAPHPFQIFKIRVDFQVNEGDILRSAD